MSEYIQLLHSLTRIQSASSDFSEPQTRGVVNATAVDTTLDAIVGVHRVNSEVSSHASLLLNNDHEANSSCDDIDVSSPSKENIQDSVKSGQVERLSYNNLHNQQKLSYFDKLYSKSKSPPGIHDVKRQNNSDARFNRSLSRSVNNGNDLSLIDVVPDIHISKDRHASQPRGVKKSELIWKKLSLSPVSTHKPRVEMTSRQVPDSAVSQGKTSLECTSTSMASQSRPNRPALSTLVSSKNQSSLVFEPKQQEHSPQGYVRKHSRTKCESKSSNDENVEVNLSIFHKAGVFVTESKREQLRKKRNLSPVTTSFRFR